MEDISWLNSRINDLSKRRKELEALSKYESHYEVELLYVTQELEHLQAIMAMLVSCCRLKEMLAPRVLKGEGFPVEVVDKIDDYISGIDIIKR